jgi:hypothetical protein
VLLCTHSLSPRKLFTFICWGSFMEVEKIWNVEPQTLKPGLLYKRYKGFLRGMFKLSISLSVSLQWAFNVLVSFCCVFWNVVTIAWTTIPFWIVTSWNLCQNLLLTFYMGIIHKFSFECVTRMCHFGMRYNATDWMFNTAPETWDYTRKAHNT